MGTLSSIIERVEGMSQHTPGPWWIEGWNEPEWYAVRIRAMKPGQDSPGGDGQTVAETQNRQDARLIAAAPEMLELLQIYARGIHLPFDHPDARAMQKGGEVARVLLARIEGR